MLSRLQVGNLDEFHFGRAPRPLNVGRGLTIGGGTVVPEINFTLAPIDIEEKNWTEVRRQYQSMIEGVVRRSLELRLAGLLVEFETLPPMTIHPDWGLEITGLLSEVLEKAYADHGLKYALRLTPNDSREFLRPPLMRQGPYWEGMVDMFDRASQFGAHMLAIESTGGKEVCDEALMETDIATVIFALSVLGARDMEFLWKKIVSSCEAQGIVASGDTACGFANTAMVLAEQKMIPRVFAALVRVASVPRSLIAYEMGAKGPSKDCAYEGPYMKAIAGVPISMEGRAAACAHVSPVGNISQAVCDCWSNESVQNVRLLSDYAPVVSMEQLIYDCRLMNTASSKSVKDGDLLRDWLTDSDSSLDPQAHVLRPDVVLKLSMKMLEAKDPYTRTRLGVLAAIKELNEARDRGDVLIPEREIPWLERLEEQVEDMPDSAEELTAEVIDGPLGKKFIPEEYGL